jgi:hypothetical protein
MAVGGNVIMLHELHQQIETAGVALPGGLIMNGPPQPVDPMHPDPPSPSDPVPAGTVLYTQDANGVPVDLPPEAIPIVEAYLAGA